MTQRILPVIIIVVALGLFFAYVHPTYTGSVALLNAEIQGYDDALVAAEEYSKKEAELVGQRSAIPEEQLARLEAFLPDGVDNVQLILDLNSLAARSGVGLSEFDIISSEKKQEEASRFSLSSEELVDSLDLSVSAVGSYESFKKFLQGTELSLRPLDLVELNIDDSTTGVYSYDITFRIYWLKNI
jgi:Tfp pilus assembly protein PilO